MLTTSTTGEGTDLSCLECGRIFCTKHDELKHGDKCPSDDCPSNEIPALKIVEEVCKEYRRYGVYSVAVDASIKAIITDWKPQYRNGAVPAQICSDIGMFITILEQLKSEIAERLLQTKTS